MNKPLEISTAEWNEIMRVPEVKEAWGVEDDLNPEDFAEMVYGVKFNYHSGSPGYVGDLYILQGDVLTGDSPFLLTRDRNKSLVMAYD